MLLGGITLILLIVLSVMYIGEAGWQWVAAVWGLYIVGTVLLSLIGINGLFIWVFQCFVVASIYFKAQSP